jgi:hypothetical protein
MMVQRMPPEATLQNRASILPMDAVPLPACLPPAAAITLSRTIRQTNCLWCRQVISLPALHCPECGMPDPLHGKHFQKPRIDTLMIAGGIAFSALCASTLSWFGTGRNWLMTLATIAGSALLIAILLRHWKRRLPLRYRGSELKFDDRPTAYHLCTFVLIFFAAGMLYAGLAAAVDDIRATRLTKPGKP